jgi:hypothetical protein
MSSATSSAELIPEHRDHRSGHHDQLIGISPEPVIGISPEHRSPSPRNGDRDHPGIPIGILRNPQLFLTLQLSLG